MISIVHLEHGFDHNRPTRIVVHAMAEYLQGQQPRHAVKFLDHYGLSAHSLVAHDGTNFRCREDNEGAFHARGYNSNSLGIEFLVPGIHDYASFLEAIKRPWLEPAQYEEGLRQIQEWCDKFDIHSIDRHSDLSPDRKVDPGEGFPFRELLHDLGR